MSERPDSISWRGFLAGAVLLVALLLVLATFLGARGGRPEPTPPAGLARYLVEPPTPAPPLTLTDSAGRPFALADHLAVPQLVFFGYTHCPDVCPQTLGIIASVIEAAPASVEASFVTVDPERDTVPFLADYERYLPAPMNLLTGTPGEIRAIADGWSVRYARVDRTDGSYSMSHTADVFLVDRAGMLRAQFPFGTEARDIVRVLALIAGDLPQPSSTSPAATGTPSPAPTPMPTSSAPASPGALRAAVVSTSVWAGPSSPVILSLYGVGGRIDDLALDVDVQLHNGVHPIGEKVTAKAVKPAGLSRVFYVATLDIPFARDWQLQITADGAPGRLATTVPLIALDSGATPALGGPAPTVRTPTLDDAGGVALAVTTVPAPDLRLSRTSTADALATGQPFVLVLDSWRFQVTPACGKALALARYLLDRWPEVAFIHLEPYRYSVVTSSAVLDGRIEDPPLVPAAEAWGLGQGPWDARSMPWIFIVDANGTVVAKYQGLVGTEDIDVILSLLDSR
jgi:protein SCO1